MKKMVLVAGMAAWLISGDWLLGLCTLVLGMGWALLQAEEGPPVLALAFTLQWVTVCIGLFYVAFTGRPLLATLSSNYEPMVLIGLGCLVALMFGLLVGQYLVRQLKPMSGVRPAYALTFKSLVFCYVIGTFLTGAVQTLAWSFPTITQAIIAITFLRLGMLYLVLRRLVANEQWAVMAGVLLFEIGLGFTGFHAGFREPLIMAVLAFLERFERRNVRHWVSLGVLVVRHGRAGGDVDQRARQLSRAVPGRRGLRPEPRRAVRQHHRGGQTVGGAGSQRVFRQHRPLHRPDVGHLLSGARRRARA